MSKDPHDDADSADSGPAFSRDAVTPRGGFMARPGLKEAPRHAVVVRLGDAPQSEEIPLARSSVAPPPPSEPAPVSASEKITLRAIPTRSTRRADLETEEAPGESPVSHAPLSDAPFAASVRPPHSSSPSSRRRTTPGWTIAIAAALGVLFGLASVATRARAPQATEPAAQPPPVSAQLASPHFELDVAAPSAETVAAAAPAPSASAEPSSLGASAPATPKNERAGHRSHGVSPAGGAATKRNIF